MPVNRNQYANLLIGIVLFLDLFPAEITRVQSINAYGCGRCYESSIF